MPPFKFASAKVHLTYKGHLDYDGLLAHVTQTVGAPKYWSIVHEEGDAEEEGADPDHDYSTGGYMHTHAAFIWPHKMQKQGHVFDFEEVHPHVQIKRSMSWMELIFTLYHWGHKTKKDGKKYYVKPFKDPMQHCPVSWSADVWDGIKECDSLKDACEYVGVRPKSISDVEKILKLSKKRPREELDEDCDRERFKEWDWDRKKALVLRGSGDSGKTNWALAQFKYPILIGDMDDLKNLPEECDGLVFDELLFDLCAKKTNVYITDMKFGRTIRCRNVNAKIPRGMQRIFCCNNDENVFMQHECMTRRYTLCEVDTQFGKMYK